MAMQYIVPQQPLQALAIEILINNLGDEDVKGNTVVKLQKIRPKKGVRRFATLYLDISPSSDISKKKREKSNARGG